MRTFGPPAWLGWPRSGRARRFWRLAEAFEVVFDKLPLTGNRTSPPQLLGRVVSGAASAVLANRAGPGSPRPFASGVTGALAAAVSTFALFHLRRWVGTRSGIRDRLLGAAEDALSFGLGQLLAV